MAECSVERLNFAAWGEGFRREVRLDFQAGSLSSDGGLPLLAQLERRSGIVKRFAACFRDHRDPDRVEHSLSALISQRIFGLALGYEDLNDHEELRHDPLLATCVGVADPTGKNRRLARDLGSPLAGKSTLQRLEAGITVEATTDRYRRIDFDARAVENSFLETFLHGRKAPSEPLILDLDATDDPIHGEQEGRFFHGYYGHYCYLPLYIFCGQSLLWAQLRPADIDAAKGSVEAVERIVTRFREHWPQVKILVRADSGFAREDLMAWCEAHSVDFVLGLARNKRLQRAIGPELHQAEQDHKESGKPERRFKDLTYQTRKTWSVERRVVAKAEVLSGKRNPRFVVTSLGTEEESADKLYSLYCQRGDMENRIKEQQLDLFADRTSAHSMKANQLRLWFSSVAYVLLAELRRLALVGTELAQAQASTIRLRLLKIGARVEVTTRRIWLSLSSAYPLAQLWRQVFLRLEEPATG